MSLIMNTFVLLFLTILIGKVLAGIRIRGVALGSAMVLFVGILVSYLAGLYAYSLPESHPLQKSAVSLMNNSIVPSQVMSVFLVFFISGVGLIASKELVPVLRKYGVKFLALSLIITTLGFLGTVAAGYLTRDYSTFEMAGVFTGALSSTPGMTAGLESSETKALAELENYEGLSQRKKDRIAQLVGGEPGENGFTEEQKAAYRDYAVTATGVGYTVTYPFGNLLVLLTINLIPLVFGIDIEEEKRKYEEEMRLMKGEPDKAESEGSDAPRSFSVLAYFFVLLVGYLIGLVKIGNFSLSATGGVLIASLVLGSMRRLSGLTFDFDTRVLKTIQEIGMVGTLGSIGLRLGYPVAQALTGTHAMLAVYAIVIGVAAMILGFLIGRYVLRMNWMMLSGAVCGGMTNTSGLGVAVDATKSEYPSIGYAATYPFAVVMMVVYTLFIQGLAF